MITLGCNFASALFLRMHLVFGQARGGRPVLIARNRNFGRAIVVWAAAVLLALGTHSNLGAQVSSAQGGDQIELLRSAATAGELEQNPVAKLGHITQSLPAPLLPSEWTYPLVVPNVINGILTTPSFDAGKAMTVFLADSKATVRTPAAGTLLYRGNIGNFEEGFILEHDHGLFSLISSPFSWEDQEQIGFGQALTRGQRLASVRSGGVAAASALRPLTWRVFQLTPSEVDQIKVGSAGLTWVERILILTKADEINTKLMLNLGILTFQFEDKASAEAISVKINGVQVPADQPLGSSFLLPAGSHDVEITSGRVFKSSRTYPLRIMAGGESVQVIARGSGGHVLKFDSLQPSDISGTISAQQRLSAATTLAQPAATDALQGSQAVDIGKPAASVESVDVQLAAPPAAPTQVPTQVPAETARASVAASANAESERLRLLETEARRRDEELARLREMLAQVERERQAQTQVVVPVAATPPAAAPAVAVIPPGKRKALVIGNDTYSKVPVLQNARTDARAIGESLRKVGFEVTTAFDLSERRMKEVLRTFRMSIQGGDQVVFFYAGHGVQLSASNYLLPIDIEGASEEQVKDEAIELQRVLDDMQERRAGFLLAIVDACRDNPFQSSGRAIGGRGLAPTSAATGQMIIFSAGAGQQALDKLGNADKEPNGLFTRLFLREMTKPDLPVDRILRNVRTEVARLARTVGHEQTPALYDQSLGDFFFTLSATPQR